MIQILGHHKVRISLVENKYTEHFYFDVKYALNYANYLIKSYKPLKNFDAQLCT